MAADGSAGRITSKANPHVKYARRLHRRRVREAEGQCLLEGVRLVRDAREAGAAFSLGFWEETVLGVPGGEELVRDLTARPPLGGFFQVHPQVMAELADTETPQGIVVVARRPLPDPRPFLEGDRPSTLVVLDNVRDPGNVGTVIRSAHASGAAAIIFLPGTADPFGPKALRASMGSAFRVPVVAAEHAVAGLLETPGPTRGGGGEETPASRAALASRVPELLRRSGYGVFVAQASGGWPHWRAPLGERAAIVLGGEAAGPDPGLWSGCELVSVPMFGGAESLNVAMAAAVLVYEAARRREGWGTGAD